MTKAPTSQRPGNARQDWALLDRSEPAGDAASQAASDANALRDGFVASMRDAGLDREEQDFLGAYFDEVVQDSAVGTSDAPALEHSDWVRAVEVLKQAGAVDESQASDLLRKLDDALQPLKRRNVQLAMEFSRRYGENREQALAWYREQVAQADTDEETATRAPAGADAFVALNMITDSRSRRLRGPPR